MAIKASPTQFEAMLDFMERNPDMTTRASSVGPHGRLTTNIKWEELSTILNSDGSGLRKDVKKWQKTWSDWKYKVKHKASRVRREIAGTGGGGKEEKDLTPLELRLLAILGFEVVEGNGALEAGLPIVQPNDDVYEHVEDIHDERYMNYYEEVMEEPLEIEDPLESPAPQEEEPLPARVVPPAALPLPARVTPAVAAPPPARVAPSPAAMHCIAARAPLQARVAAPVAAPQRLRPPTPAAAPLQARLPPPQPVSPPPPAAAPLRERPHAAEVLRRPQHPPGRRRRAMGGRQNVLDIQQEYVALRREIEDRNARDANVRMQIELENARARQAEANNMARLISLAESLQPAVLRFLEKQAKE